MFGLVLKQNNERVLLKDIFEMKRNFNAISKLKIIMHDIHFVKLSSAFYELVFIQLKSIIGFNKSAYANVY